MFFEKIPKFFEILKKLSLFCASEKLHFDFCNFNLVFTNPNLRESAITLWSEKFNKQKINTNVTEETEETEWMLSQFGKNTVWRQPWNYGIQLEIQCNANDAHDECSR